MVTVRTFWTPAEAALAKSLLDNYEIESALLNENSNIYLEGGQVAVPTRLVVDEAEAIRADLILKAEFEKADELELAEETSAVVGEETASSEVASRNPWELLVIAFYFLLPGICLVITKFPVDHLSGRWAGYFIARATIAHFLAWVGVISAACLVTFYFWIRRSARTLSAK
jgi:hypothetical protein